MQQNFSALKKVVLLICCITSNLFSYAVVRYVKTGGAGTAPYITWATASSDLQAVINACSAGDEIWIAAGTYKPNRRADALTVSTPTDRNDAFVLKNGVKVYGGFTGVEIALNQRNSTTNVVTLSGDIGTVGVTTDNCYHVVICAGLSITTTLLDGVSIASGNANAAVLVPNITVNTHSINPRYGGGMYKVSSNIDLTDCRFRRNNASLSGAGVYENLSAVNSVYSNCTFTQNSSAGDGGGLYISTSSCLYQNCSFTSNDATDDGGGIYSSGTGSPAFSNTIITSNSATGEGGGVYLTGSGSPTFTDCTISSNTAGSNGGAVASYTTGTAGITATIISGNTSGSTGGGVFNNNSPAAITNCLISGNLAAGGGGIWNALSDAVIINCTIAGNKATAQGGGIANGTSNPVIQNCVVYGNAGVPTTTNTFYNSGSTPAVDYSLIQGGFTGTGNVDANPLFVNGITAALSPTTSGDYRVQNCSPVLNAGENSYIPAGITTDLDGNPRINYSFVDMGAYEKQLALAVPDANGIVYVDYTKTGNGSSWANAVADLSDALVAAKFNSSILQVWVAKGIYKPKYNYSYRPLQCNYTDRSNSFVLTNNIKLYGGFAPGETDTTTRDLVLNETILSGDIGIINDKTDNCYNVLQSLGLLVYMNGLTITKGYNTATAGGAGLLNLSQSLKISYCNFFYNETPSGLGGGIYNTSFRTLDISYCSFVNNISGSQGGGIFSDDNGHVKVDHSTFELNKSGNGAGIHITDASGISSVSSCIFSGNESVSLGGGMCSHERININNTLFSGNKSTNGGALHLDGVGVHLIYNSTIASNLATQNGSAIYGAGSVSIIGNSIIYGNSGIDLFLGPAPVITNSVVQGSPVYAGSGNINSDPLFMIQIPAGSAPTIGGDYHLKKCSPQSPAIDAGDNSQVPVGVTTDLDEQARIVNGTVDMGAYETHYAFHEGGRVYIDKTKNGKGTSWADAAPELADAVREAKYNTAIKEIWVAKGTYTPLYNAADGTETFCKIPGRDNAFVLPPDVKLYGGFAGGETDTSGRDFVANETILSGDIGIANDTIDNCYHVLIGAGISTASSIDGFTIKNGNATYLPVGDITVNGFKIVKYLGGGLYADTSVIDMANCKFSFNYAGWGGAGLFQDSGSLTIKNSSFVNNVLRNLGGGGIFNRRGILKIDKCSFKANETTAAGSYGAGIYITTAANSLISNSLFSGNKTIGDGAGIYSFSSTPSVINCTFSGNKAATYGALYGTAVIKNSIIWNNSPALLTPGTRINSIIEGGAPGAGNLNLSPQFIAQVSPSAAPTTSGDYHLQACSPAINAGDNSFVPAGIGKDLDSFTRIKYTTVDMGAYETQSIDLANSTWKGVNTDWNDKVNWCGGYIPYDTTNVIIPTGLANYPVVGTGFTNGVKNMLLGNGSSLGISNTSQFSVFGTYTNNGSAISNNGTLTLAGNASGQSFPGVLGSVVAMNNLEINNPSGVVLNKSFSITGALMPTAGNINLDNDTITLKSTRTGTASVWQIGPLASISYTGTGKFEVQRFINTGTVAANGEHPKSWQFLSTPVSGQSIFQSWQESGTTPSGFGTIITGTGSGFDITTALPSMKYYDEAAVNWKGVTNTSAALQNKLGYMLFVRGDRSVTTFNGTPNNTVMRSRGIIHSPTNLPPAVTVAANKFQTVGNPYPARISFSSLYGFTTAIDNVFYVWDPLLPGNYNLGGWQTISGLTGYIPTVGVPPSGNPATAYYPAGAPAPYIESGQAFFVHGNGTGGNVVFNESCKATGSRLVNRGSLPLSNQAGEKHFLSAGLFNGAGLIADGNVVVFDRFLSNEVDHKDALKIINDGENFGIQRNGSILAVEAHNKIRSGDTIFYFMNHLRRQNYKLAFAPQHITTGVKAWLIDSWNNQRTTISLQDSTWFSFSVTDDPASARSDRFMLVFRNGEYESESLRNETEEVMTSNYVFIKVSPNPVSGSVMTIQTNSLPNGNYELNIYTITGQLVMKQLINLNDNQNQVRIRLPGSFAKGTYQLTMVAADGKKYTDRFIYNAE
ncbi:MAG: choice-of-anchor Q domain-containing protein [Ferruginibacter sp.]